MSPTWCQSLPPRQGTPGPVVLSWWHPFPIPAMPPCECPAHRFSASYLEAHVPAQQPLLLPRLFLPVSSFHYFCCQLGPLPRSEGGLAIPSLRKRGRGRNRQPLGPASHILCLLISLPWKSYKKSFIIPNELIGKLSFSQVNVLRSRRICPTAHPHFLLITLRRALPAKGWVSRPLALRPWEEPLRLAGPGRSCDFPSSRGDGRPQNQGALS